MTFEGKHVSPDKYLDLISFDNFKVSWVGSLGNSVCYGSEDGRLKFVTPDGIELADTDPVTESGEAINGLAAINFCQVVTTRADITFMWNQFINGGEKKSANIRSGAHGVVATRGGHFVAPMGERGMMIVSASENKEPDVLVSNDSTNPLYFYQSIALPGANDSDVIVSAVRKKGIAAGILSHDFSNHLVSTITPHDVDVIDVCGLGHSLATAALGKNGTLILFHDILADKDPRTFKFKSIEGVAYRVVCARGHVFVLTSKGLYFLADLAKNFLQGTASQGAITQILTLTVTAVDANLFNDRFLYIVNDEGDVFRLDIEKLERDIPRKTLGQNRFEPPAPEIRFEWNESTFKNTGALKSSGLRQLTVGHRIRENDYSTV